MAMVMPPAMGLLSVGLYTVMLSSDSSLWYEPELPSCRLWVGWRWQ